MSSHVPARPAPQTSGDGRATTVGVDGRRRSRPRRQAAAARLAARRHVPGRSRRRHRAGRARRRHRARPSPPRSTPTSAALLFGVSAIYHRGHWSPRAEKRLKRLDHSNIFLIIAGTYTPFSLVLLHGHGGNTLLWIVWAAALGGIAFRVFWVGAPRWLYTPVYIALGWVAVFYLPGDPRTPAASPSSRCWRSAAGSTASAASSTRSSSPTRHRAGSASTRSSTR